jgi:hypothetical protein
MASPLFDPDKIVRVVIPEMDWLGENRKRLEQEIPGKWIGIKGRELIAVGDTLAEVMRIAKAKNIEQPFVTAMPREEYQNVIIIRSPRLISKG